MTSQPVTMEQLKTWADNCGKDPIHALANMALAKHDLNDVASLPARANEMRQKFSVELKTLPVTNQHSSGRCWLFAATNVLRETIAKEKNMKEFELSQSYLAFWDKFERANYFLESILQTADCPVDDRKVMFILQTGVHDGGQWDMFSNIVRKYGIVPLDVYDDTHQTDNTKQLNYVLNRYLKARAMELRRMVAAGEGEEAIQAKKNEALAKCYSFLTSCYGDIPEQFDFEYVDKDGNYHIEKGYTPLTFRDAYVKDELDHLISCINAPTADKPYHKTFTVAFLGNVVGGQPVKHLNLTMDEFKGAIIRQLQAGVPVWFGSDVGHYGDRIAGIWDDKLFNYELLTGLDMAISKVDALDSTFSAMNHAMVITGVNLVDGKPTRWKIENSWGEDRGVKGYYVCSDSWFDQYVYQAAIRDDALGELAALAKQEPVELDPWDPMGTLAD